MVVPGSLSFATILERQLLKFAAILTGQLINFAAILVIQLRIGPFSLGMSLATLAPSVMRLQLILIQVQTQMPHTRDLLLLTLKLLSKHEGVLLPHYQDQICIIRLRIAGLQIRDLRTTAGICIFGSQRCNPVTHTE